MIHGCRICKFVMLCNEIESTHECLYNQFQKAQLMGKNEFANVLLTEIKNGVGGNIKDFIEEYAKQLKEQSNE